jgi:hypothetical protein
MEFLSIEGSHHILQPIGYGIIEKIVKPGSPVRSAAEQFTIQNEASMFESAVLYIPKPIRLENRSYTMEMFYDLSYLPISYYTEAPLLLNHLIHFIHYMLKLNYFIHSFDIYIDVRMSRYVLLDFSHTGFIMGTTVQFKNDENQYSIDEADMKYGILIPSNPVYI